MKFVNTETVVESQQDWWNKISKKQQNAIDKALAEMKAGKLTPHDVVMKEYKKWLKTKPIS